MKTVMQSAMADSTLGSIPVNVQLTNLPKITVEKPTGGWYDVVELSNSSGSDVTHYEAQLPIKVTIRNERYFMVSLLDPLVLMNENDSTLTFSSEQVSFGTNPTTSKILDKNPSMMTNPPMIGSDSIGNYILSISAYQPKGALGNVSGKYVGKLILMFEISV